MKGELSAATLDQFSSFVARAVEGRAALASRPDEHRAERLAIGAFDDFVRQALPIATARLVDLVERLSPRASLRRFTDGPDLLHVAGLTGAEDPYTELLGWALGVEADPDSALIRQRAVLDALPFAPALDLVVPARIATQVWTADGIPDLVMSLPHASIIVEAKTWTEEHVTPGGRMQTHAYPEALRAAWRLAEDHRVHVVFLTPDGRAPANANAAVLTYARLAAALADAIEGVSLPPRTRAAFELLIGHWLRMPLRGTGSLRRFLESAETWARDARERPELLLGYIADLEIARIAFLPGETDGFVPVQ